MGPSKNWSQLHCRLTLQNWRSSGMTSAKPGTSRRRRRRRMKVACQLPAGCRTTPGLSQEPTEIIPSHSINMTPQRRLVQQHPSTVTQKLQLTYKILLIENARNKLDQELRSLTNKAYDEVQGFLSSSCPTGVFTELSKSLDVKCQAIHKLSALLKDITLEPRVCLQPNDKNGLRTNHQPPTNKGILTSDVLKFGPMLQNSLMACSIAKAVQVLGATLSLQQLKHLIVSQPTVQEDEMTCNISSSYNSSVVTTSSSCRLEATEETQVVFEASSQPDAVILPLAIIQSPEINTERPPLLLPPLKAILSEISNPKPTKITPLISWGREYDVQVQHQKQTSSQLLHFLRAKAKTMGALEVTVLEWHKTCIYNSSHSFSHVADGLMDAVTPKTLHSDSEFPIFRVKRGEPSGSLTYTCVIATKTDLWDIAHIVTEVGQESTDDSCSESGEAQVENSCVTLKCNSNTLSCTNAQHENKSAAAKAPETRAVTIREFQIQRFDEMEVVVSHIVSPGNFHIQHADSITKLQALVTDSMKASSSYAKQNCIPDIGTLVMGWFPTPEQWCRAQVTKICGVSGDNSAVDGAKGETSIKVEVRRLDHGDAAVLSLSNVKELTPDMADLPKQSVQVSLANVKPINGKDWSEEAVGWFKAMVHNRMLYARLYTEGPNVTVELFLEKGKLGAMRRGASLSLRLAQNGHAKHSKLKNIVRMRKSSVQVKMRKKESDWEKYLISCYAQRNSGSMECA